jgi:ribosome modulation factor
MSEHFAESAKKPPKLAEPAPPPDHVLLNAFNRGAAQGCLGAKYYRDECPYGESKPWHRDAWLAGYDEAWTPAA